CRMGWYWEDVTNFPPFARWFVHISDMKSTNTHNIAVACGQDVRYVGDVATYIHGPSMLWVKHIVHKVEAWNGKEACLVLIHMRLLETDDVYVLLACYDVNDTTFGC